jgi:gliding motility-associated-like protein
MANQIPDMIQKKGVLITSDFVVSVYFYIEAGDSYEVFPLKAHNALGTLFVIPSQYHFGNSEGNESFDIVATEDMTTIHIYPNNDISGHQSGVPFDVTLDAGQTFSCQATDPSPVASLHGSRITSDKPIAITIKDDALQTGKTDLIGDQLIAASYLSRSYFILRGQANPEMVYIQAIYDDTWIYLNGNNTAVAVLDSCGSHATQIVDEVLIITASRPVYVYHVSGMNGKLSSAIVPSNDQPETFLPGTFKFGFDVQSSASYSIGLITETNYRDDFLINNQPDVISSDDFRYIPGTYMNWSYAWLDEDKLSRFNGQVIIENTQGLFYMEYQIHQSIGDGYGYVFDFELPGGSIVDIGPDTAFCSGVGYMLDAGPDINSYLWSTGETSQRIVVYQTGLYWVNVVKYGYTFSDTVSVQVYPSPEIVQVEYVAQGEIIIHVGSGTPPYKYSIDGGATFQWDSHFYGLVDGDYNVVVEDGMGCQSTKVITIKNGSPDSDVELYIPNVFSPNGDGINDVWKVDGISAFPDAMIYIFDRYGKLIISGAGAALQWDGTLNGNPLPSDDYWYAVDLKNGTAPIKGNVRLFR